MRPPLSSRRTLDLPRWRRRRASDLQSLALAYGLALAFFLGLLAAICFLPGGLTHGGGDFQAAVLIVFALAAYVALGGSVVALTVRRLAYWNGGLISALTRANWFLVILWPIAVAALLVKAALSPWA